MTSQKKSKLTKNLVESVLIDINKNDATAATAIEPFPLNSEEENQIPSDDPMDMFPFGEQEHIDFDAQIEAMKKPKPVKPTKVDIAAPPPEEPMPLVVPTPAPPSRRAEAAIAANKSMPLIEADLKQSENLKMAQARILELEASIESLRLENENLTAAQQVVQEREEDFSAKVQNLERSRIEIREQWTQEIAIFKDNLNNRDTEVQRLRTRIDELENRLQSDLRRVRVRERELENRLEIGKNDKIAIVKAKDETILDLKRKMDQLYSDLEKYKQKCLDLSYKIDLNNEQFGRTIRALRIALANLEAAEETKSTSSTALKKVD